MTDHSARFGENSSRFPLLAEQGMVASRAKVVLRLSNTSDTGFELCPNAWTTLFGIENGDVHLLSV